MTLSAEILTAYVDGELPPEEARRVEAEIAGRPDLQAYVEQQRTLARAMHDSFDDILQAPVPEVLRAALSRPASSRWQTLWASHAARRLVLWAGMPAAAALGLLVGFLFVGRGDIVSSNGSLIAHGELAQALTEQLASQPMQSAAAKVGITFRDKTGRYCRTFQTSASAPLAGVACRDDGEWRVAAVAKTVSEPAAAYQPAGSAMPDLVRSSVSAMISGTPLDAEGERKAKASGWAAH